MPSRSSWRPRAAEAQSPAARIGLLGPADEPRFSEIAAGLKQGLREQGYGEDTIHVVEGRSRRGDEVRAPATVQALVGERVTVLFVVGSALARLARKTVPQLPIVFVTPGDPVVAGLLASFARAGGNMTAMTFEYPELSGKRPELLRELAPRIRRVVVQYDSVTPRPGSGSPLPTWQPPRLLAMLAVRPLSASVRPIRRSVRILDD